MLTLFVTKRIPVEPFDGRSFRFILTRLWLTSLTLLRIVGDGRHVLLGVSGRGLFKLMVPLGHGSSRWDDSRGYGWLRVVQFIGQRSDVRTLIRRPLVNANHMESGHQTSTDLQSILIFLLLRGGTPPSCLAPTRSASGSGKDTRGRIGRTGRPFPFLPGSLTGRLVENPAFTHALLPRGSADRAAKTTEDTFETGSSAGRGVSNAGTPSRRGRVEVAGRGGYVLVCKDIVSGSVIE